MMDHMKKGIAALACVVFLALPGAAFAQSGVSGYEDNGSQVQGLVQGGGGGGGGETTTSAPAATTSAPAATADTGGTLPFTGAELGVLAGTGAVLVLLGFGLRRMTQRPGTA